MVKRGPRYEPEEFARRGMEIYERDIKPQLSPEQKGLYVAIDIETGMYEIDKSAGVAVHRLYDRRPEAQPWMVRVGYRATVHFGYREDA